MKTIFNIIGTVIVIAIFLIAIFLMVKKVVIPIIKEIKSYKKLNKDQKEKFQVLAIIFFSPIILLCLDYLNVFSKLFPQYLNLSREYDWLSFIGTYSGAIISAILLIFITEKDREENTNVIRESQRPYLEVSYMKIDERYFKDNKNNITVFEHGKSEEKKNLKKEYLSLCIKNTGSTVAIIDTNKTKVKLSYKDNKRIADEEIFLNFSIERLSIRSGEEIYIKFIKDELYNRGKLIADSKIVGSTVYYKDLFNKKYYDECELNGILKVLHDNEEIE